MMPSKLRIIYRNKNPNYRIAIVITVFLRELVPLMLSSHGFKVHVYLEL